MALVTSGFYLGGGVITIVRWLRDFLLTTGDFAVDLHDLATSRRDPSSRRLVDPRSWLRASLREDRQGEELITHWGANAVEIEAMRYRPRLELNRALRDYDLIQVVAGTPALAAAVTDTGVPTALICATAIAWERQRLLAEQAGLMRAWRGLMTAVNHRIEQGALRQVDALLVLNSKMGEYGRSAGARRVSQIHFGTDTSIFAPHPDGWQRRGHLLSVCRFADPRKGLDRMISAYERMVRVDQSVPELVLTGIGVPPQPLLDQIRNANLNSRVRICSDVGPDTLLNLYRQASVFLQTSYEEGLGISVLEAMACGLPVVSTVTDGSRETVVDGVTGWLVPQEAEGGVAESIAERTLDVLREGTAEMSTRARNRAVTAFSREAAARTIVAVYDALAPAKTARAG